MMMGIQHKLAKEILRRVRIDQRMRKRHIAGKGRWDKGIDRKNTAWLKKVMKKYGWPTIFLVGKKASQGAWLLAQHADHDIKFQKRVLRILKELHKNSPREINLKNIAFLTDRVLIHERKPQIFGTQFRKTGIEKFEPLPIKTRRNLDALRKKFGLSSLASNTKKINREWKRLGGK